MRFQRQAARIRHEAKAHGDKLPIAPYSSSELAYQELASDMCEYFDNIDGRSLNNLHSEWKSGRFDSAENDTDSEEYDAEIERQFPAPKESF